MTALHCACGQTALLLQGPPIVTVACCCNSCRAAAGRMKCTPVLGPYGETHFVLYRKDRVTFPSADQMASFRLTPTSSTRRVASACCSTPLFLEFKGGHWVSLYADLWHHVPAPPAQLRTMTSDLQDPSILPDDIPNARTQGARFMWALLTAWISMRFRSPRISVAGEQND